MSAASPSPLQRGARALGRAVIEVDRFVRLHFLGFSFLWPLLGAVSVNPDIDAGDVSAALLVALCFHLYAGVFNDVIDLDVDRTQPLRAGDPLVRGAISPAQALAFALAQVPLAFVLAVWLGAGAAALASLAAAFLLMAVYNLWGKSCPVPPLTDAAQGFAWGFLALYGAFAQGSPGALTFTVCGYAVGYLLLINGVHGGLRDLDNDLACGRRTTAIYLGARRTADGIGLPARAWVFCFVLQSALVLLSFLPLLQRDVYAGFVRALVSALVTIVSAVNLWLMARVLRPGGTAWEMAFRLHLALLLVPLLVLALGYADALAGGVLLLMFCAPLLLLDWTHEMLRRVGGRLFARPI